MPFNVYFTIVILVFGLSWFAPQGRLDFLPVGEGEVVSAAVLLHLIPELGPCETDQLSYYPVVFLLPLGQEGFPAVVSFADTDHQAGIAVAHVEGTGVQMISLEDQAAVFGEAGTVFRYFHITFQSPEILSGRTKNTAPIPPDHDLAQEGLNPLLAKSNFGFGLAGERRPAGVVLVRPPWLPFLPLPLATETELAVRFAYVNQLEAVAVVAGGGFAFDEVGHSSISISLGSGTGIFCEYPAGKPN